MKDFISPRPPPVCIVTVEARAPQTRFTFQKIGP